MDSLMGMSMDVWRVITVAGSICAVILYIYRIYCLINLMKKESELLTGNNRLIYAGLIFLIPLGIGAWIYDYVVNQKTASPLFIIPFISIILIFIYSMFHMMPHATNFNFDFMSW